MKIKTLITSILLSFCCSEAAPNKVFSENKIWISTLQTAEEQSTHFREMCMSIIEEKDDSMHEFKVLSLAKFAISQDRADWAKAATDFREFRRSLKQESIEDIWLGDPVQVRRHEQPLEILWDTTEKAFLNGDSVIAENNYRLFVSQLYRPNTASYRLAEIYSNQGKLNSAKHWFNKARIYDMQLNEYQEEQRLLFYLAVKRGLRNEKALR